MTASVCLKSAAGGAQLTLSEHAGNFSAGRRYFIATLEDVSLLASTPIYAGQAETLAALFAEMATQWRGWAGEKRAGTLEDDLELVCTSDSLGHVFVTVRLISWRDGWQVQARLQLEAGQLDRLAREFRAFWGQS